MIAVLSKSFRVLETLNAVPGPLSLAAITKRVEQPKPTVLRILRTLASLGYVVQDSETGEWSVTARLAELGRGRGDTELTRRYHPVMQRLHSRFNETINLGVLEGAHIRYVDVIETTRPLRMMMRPGATDAAHSTALGRAILAWRTQPEREAVMAKLGLQPRTNRTVTEPEELSKLMERARDRGWTLDDEENEPGVVCMAVPLIEDNVSVGAISVTVPAIRATPERRREIVDTLQSLTREVRR